MPVTGPSWTSKKSRPANTGTVRRALELGLADEILTSDELLKRKAAERDLYHVVYKIKQPLQKRVFANIDGLLEKAESSSWRRRFESRLPR